MAAWTLLLCKLVSSFAVRIYGTDAEFPGTLKNQDQMCQTLTAEMNLEDEDAIFKLASEAIQEKHDDDSVAVLRCLKNHLNATGPSKESLLFPAVVSGNLQALDFLIASGVPVALRNQRSVSAAEEALKRNQKNPGKCLERLLDAGLDPNEPSPRKCKYASKQKRTCMAKWTLAHYATRYNATLLPILKKDRADMNRKDLMGFSPAHVAVREGDLGAVLELQKLNASFDLADNEEQTPAHLVCWFVRDEGKNKTVKPFESIQESKGRLDARNKDGETPAHKCARRGDTNALRFLLEAVPKSFQVRDNGGMTPQEVGNSVAVFFLANFKAEEEKKRAEREKDRAEQEQKKAQKSERQAHEQRSRAEKSEKEITKLHADQQAVVKMCKELSEQVHELFDCGNNSMINVPEGFMIAGKPYCSDDTLENWSSITCAVRCPNPYACINHSMVLEHGAVDLSKQIKQCSDGYDETSEGCSRCEVDFGRQRQDPFQCKRCEKPWRGWFAYVAKPVGIYGFSIWTAKKVEKERLGLLLKICLSFGMVVASITPSVQSSERGLDVYKWAVGAVNSGGDVGSFATLLSGPSYDCLLGERAASISAWLGLSCAPALVLWLLSIIFWVAQSTLQHTTVEGQRLLRDVMKISIVATNCFLPDMVAALIRFLPCMHFQYPESSTRYMQFDVTQDCFDVPLTRSGALVSAFLASTLLGPVYWVIIIRKSKDWTDHERKRTLGFLVSGYKEEVCWWEAVVLVRKCAVAAVVATFSASYAPMLYLSFLLLVVGTGLACHGYVQPYEDPFLNRLEFGTLMASSAAVFCTSLLKLESFAWAADWAVTMPALVALFFVVTLPSIALIVLYVQELRRGQFTLFGFQIGSENVKMGSVEQVEGSGSKVETPASPRGPEGSGQDAMDHSTK